MTRKKRSRKEYWVLSIKLTPQQWNALDGRSFAEGVPRGVKARHILADALNVPRETASGITGAYILDPERAAE
jgi:hypothetical protein